MLPARPLALAPGAGAVPLVRGDRVRVRGTYRWNALGGALADTYADPDSVGGGWIIHDGRIYS